MPHTSLASLCLVVEFSLTLSLSFPLPSLVLSLSCSLYLSLPLSIRSVNQLPSRRVLESTCTRVCKYTYTYHITHQNNNVYTGFKSIAVPQDLLRLRVHVCVCVLVHVCLNIRTNVCMYVSIDVRINMHSHANEHTHHGII